jgi:hypothetical protein
LSEREPSATVAPQAAEVSAGGLGADPPSRSESAGNTTAPRGALAHPRRDEAKGRESGASRGVCTPATISPPSRSESAGLALTSYCVACDALPGGCGCNGARYLEPIVYEPTDAGWRVPERELHRFHNPPAYPSREQRERAAPLAELHAAIAEQTDVGPALARTVGNAYELNAVRASRIVRGVIEGYQAGEVRNVGAMLMHKLRPRGAA